MTNHTYRGHKQIYNQDIWDIIKEHVGAFNAISQYEIVNKYLYRHNDGITDRSVRVAIRELRREGYPILSTPHKPGGYFIPFTHEEAKEWRERMRKKAVKELAIINPVLKACNKMFSQKISQLEMFT